MGDASGLQAYVQQMKQTGYDEATIRSYLLSQGYAQEQINQAFGRKFPVIFVVVMILVVVLGAAVAAVVLFILPAATALSVKAQPATIEVSPGAALDFAVSIKGAEPSKVTLTARVLDAQGKPAQVTSNVQGTTGKLVLGEQTTPGRYFVELTAREGKRTGRDTFAFQVVVRKTATPRPPTTKPSSSSSPSSGAPDDTTGDGLGTSDPSAPTGAAATDNENDCPLGCNDYNPCTVDSCVRGVCQSTAVAGACCGDLRCEGGETSVTCPGDCQETPSLPSTEDLVALAGTTYATDAQKAINLCQALPKLSEKDICFSEVARKNVAVDVCKNMYDDTQRDNCYMYFVLKHDEFTVCDQFANALNEDTCYSMQVLKRAQADALAAAAADTGPAISGEPEDLPPE